MSISLLFPSGLSVKTNRLSVNTQHDLGLDVICKHIAKNGDEERYLLNVISEMTDSPEVAAYRIEIFDDLIHHRKIRDDLMEILRKIRLMNEYGRIKKVHTDAPGVWDLIHRLEELKDYLAAVEALRGCLSGENIKSKGLIALRDYVKQLFEEQGFRELRDDIRRLQVSLSGIKSVTLGINLNERFEACGVGLISINNQNFTKSPIIRSFSDFISGRDVINEGTEWNGTYKYDSVTVAPIPDGDSGADVMHNFDSVTDSLLNLSIKKLKGVLAKYVSVSIENILRLLPEFTYYIRWAEFITDCMEKGYHFCKAEVIPGVNMHAEEIYNIKLACLGIESETIVTNNLEFNDEKCVYILTGANRGGKTTITQAVGLQFVLAGGGIYVTGKKFQFSPADCVFTHFPVDEENTMNLGRLGEECKRFHDLFFTTTRTSLILLNESFSTTAFEEGYYIAKDSVRAILDKGVRTIFNTHMHKLGFDIEELNTKSRGTKAASLVAKTEEHKRSYKVEIGPPEGISLARDIAEKYGVTYELLIENNDRK